MYAPSPRRVRCGAENPTAAYVRLRAFTSARAIEYEIQSRGLVPRAIRDWGWNREPGDRVSSFLRVNWLFASGYEISARWRESVRIEIARRSSLGFLFLASLITKDRIIERAVEYIGEITAISECIGEKKLFFAILDNLDERGRTRLNGVCCVAYDCSRDFALT